MSDAPIKDAPPAARKHDVLLAQEYLAFLLLNLFDLFLTGYIFRHHGQEANGIAIWVLRHFKLVGFVVYKFLLVLILVLACEGIARKSLRMARLIVTAGCALYLCLVFWESYLIYGHIHSHRPLSG